MSDETATVPDGHPNDILRVRNLTTRFFTDEGAVNAVDGVSFDVRDGEVFGVVGESGSGKSVTALSIVDLVDSTGQVIDGEVWFRDGDLASTVRDDNPGAVDGAFVNLPRLPDRIRRSLRGTSFSFVFQDPMSSLNPSITVGTQIAEAVEVQRRADANPRRTRSRTQGYGLVRYVTEALLPGQTYESKPSKVRAVELLEKVGIPDPAKRADQYPHEFSGGMLQRAIIAQALAGEPDILVADEPTTALDVTIQAEILNLLQDLQNTEDMSVILITHDLGVIVRMCNRVGVMYAGQVVERGTLETVFTDPVHPYTQGLLDSVPDPDHTASRLQPIEGNVPSLIDEELPDRCYFADRCPNAMGDCLEPIPEYEVERLDDADHTARCVLATRPYEPGDGLHAEYFEESSGPDVSDEGDSTTTDDPSGGSWKRTDQ
jgi:peptide/nickel transport system ATP-binding protein